MIAGSPSVPPDAASAHLAFEPASVALARTHVLAALPPATSRQGVQAVQVVVSELVANAVAHGRPTATGGVDLAWWLHAARVLRVSVRDGGHVEHLHPRLPGPHAVGGRGLLLVAHLSLRWHWHLDGGVRVTADLDLG